MSSLSRRSFALASLLLPGCSGGTRGAADSARGLDDVTTSSDTTLPDDVVALPDDVVTPPDDVVTPPGDVVTLPDDAAATPPDDLTAPGPLSPLVYPARAVTMPTSTGCAGNDCRLTVTVTTPSAGAGTRVAPFPLVVFTNGFQVPSTQYQSYALRLARWGYTVLTWDTTSEGGVIPRSISHRVLAAMLRALPSQLGDVAATTDVGHVVFAGHSRGGKLSALAASANPVAVGLVGLDPVDGPPPMTAAGPDYPSGAAALAMFAGPSVFVGSALGATPAPSSFGMACAPAAANYTQFFTAASPPSLEVTMAQVGHMQFLDDEAHCPRTAIGTLCSVCTAGSTADELVRERSQVLLLALAERATRGADVSAYLTPAGSWLASQSSALAVRAK